MNGNFINIDKSIIFKYEYISKYREQDFQLLEALAKRLLSNDNDREDHEEALILTAFDQDQLIKLRTLCKRLKHYNSVEKLLSTMFIRVILYLIVFLTN